MPSRDGTGPKTGSRGSRSRPGHAPARRQRAQRVPRLSLPAPTYRWAGRRAVIASAPVAEVPANAPVVTSRARPVAVVARPESCIACGTCVDTCPRGAIAIDEIAVIDASLCNSCGRCVDDCSYGALALAEV